MIFSILDARRETIRVILISETSQLSIEGMATDWPPEGPPSASRLFVRTEELSQRLCYEPWAPPVRYRLVCQLVEVITTGESIERSGHVCELRLRDLPEFGNATLQEGIRAVVGDRVYESSFNAMGSPLGRDIPREGCALNVILGVLLESDGGKVLEVLDLEVLKRRDIQALRSFVQSSVGSQLISS